MADTSSPVGTWYLLANTFRLEMVIRRSNAGFTGTIANEGGAAEPLSNISWNSPMGMELARRRAGTGKVGKTGVRGTTRPESRPGDRRRSSLAVSPRCLASGVSCEPTPVLG